MLWPSARQPSLARSALTEYLYRDIGLLRPPDDDIRRRQAVIPAHAKSARCWPAFVYIGLKPPDAIQATSRYRDIGVCTTSVPTIVSLAISRAWRQQDAPAIQKLRVAGSSICDAI